MKRDAAVDGWNVVVDAGLAELSDALRHAVAIAVLAPSGHNSQPWRFVISGERVELWADKSRRLPVVDPDDRELIMSCGAALAFLRLAVENAGFQTTIDILPAGLDSDLVAVLTASARMDAGGAHADQIDAIVKRRTNRNQYRDRPVADSCSPRCCARRPAPGRG